MHINFPFPSLHETWQHPGYDGVDTQRGVNIHVMYCDRFSPDRLSVFLEIRYIVTNMLFHLLGFLLPFILQFSD